MSVDEIVVSYLITLKNAGITCISRADLNHYLVSIGLDKKKCVKGVNHALKFRKIILLKNGKVSLNLTKK